MDSSHATPYPAAGEPARAHAHSAPPLRIGLLTGADDRPYALGLTGGLLGRGVGVDFIGSDQVHANELAADPLLRFLNLRGDQSESVSALAKAVRLLRYYARLIGYALAAEPKVFHILWNNKFEWFDRTLLMLIYRALGRRVVLTAHNVNKAKRDGHDSAFNRVTLRIQYRLAHHVFVHTEKMREELLRDFSVAPRCVSLVPFGMNEAMPKTGLTIAHARERLGIGADDKVLLFFGQIAPYKGLRYLVDALPTLLERDPSYRLLIAGKVKQGVDNDWPQLDARLAQPALAARVTRRVQFIPDSDVELYFQAADVLVMPYVDIFQSGVLFLSYDFGLPVVATDVGTLREDIVEGRTGHVCAPQDPAALGQAIERHFASTLHQDREASRQAIRAWAHEGHSWAGVAGLSEVVYRNVLGPH